MSLCSVCCIPTTEIHYGVVTCSACAAFFRRSVRNHRVYKCRFDSHCDISHKKRLSCRYCRYQKCLSEGMIRDNEDDHDSPPGIENNDGTPSILTEECLYNSVEIKDVLKSKPSSEIHSTIKEILKQRLQNIFEHRVPTPSKQLETTPSIIEQALSAYEEHKRRWPGSTKANLHPADVEHPFDLNQYIIDFYAEMEYAALFCMHIECFATLSAEQKWSVYKNFFQPFCDLERAFVSNQLLGSADPEDDRHVSYDGLVFSTTTPSCNVDIINLDKADVLEASKLMLDTYSKALNNMIAPVRKLKPDEFEFVYMLLCALLDYIDDSKFVTGEPIVDTKQLRIDVDEELHDYYINELKLNNYADRVHKMSNIVASFTKLDVAYKEFRQLTRTFDMAKDSFFLTILFDL